MRAALAAVMARFDARDVAAIIGAACMAGGIGTLWRPAAGFVALGIYLLWKVR
jgi:hypothetical protein